MESAQDQERNEGLLVGLLAEIDQLATRDANGYFDPEIGSALYLDDVAVYPLKVSAPARISILASIDLLMTIRDIARAGTIPMVGMAPLLRAALETACVAIYLLDPDRRTRVTRALCEEYVDIEDHENAIADLQPAESVNRAGHEEFIRRAIGSVPHGPTWEEVVGARKSITRKIEVAEPAIERMSQGGRGAHTVRGYWRVFSGLTHGRQYAARMVLDREELGYDDQTGTVTAQLTFSSLALVGTLRVVLDAVQTAIKLYGQLGRQFTRTPEDTIFEATLRSEGRL